MVAKLVRTENEGAEKASASKLGWYLFKFFRQIYRIVVAWHAARLMQF